MQNTAHKITAAQIERYRHSMSNREYAQATIEKYTHIVHCFYDALGNKPITKEAVLAYKKQLLGELSAASVNAAVAALNNFFDYIGRQDCKVKPVKIQRSSCRDEHKELSKEEYRRLLETAKANGQARLCCLLETMCATGVRVSEIRYITIEAVRIGRVEVRNKGKSRTVFLPNTLCQKLKVYCAAHKIRSGSVFVTRTGKPLNRSNIWAMMKRLCKTAKVETIKVFPHNLRHLFARLFYEKHHDLDHLAVVLGHSNINTTRIYTQTCESEYQKQVEALYLLL